MTRAKGKASLAGLDLVACIGGPMAGHWYHRSDWVARRDAARRMEHDETHPAGGCLAYVEDRGPATVPHPTDTGGIGHAARWAL
ncbi:hypothetical protein [Angustibacter luteus]|uniref:Uncharacterized protein n=1 Tax=Angustibacter luteus TaxID=658456 RepID=A0ABW1JID6_9ACTN